jgi:adenine-specific DNA-methyltransferase
MSRLTELLRRVEQRDPELAKELASEVKTLSGRRAFGLNFERHVPETVELPGRRVRRGDKVRFLAPRECDAAEFDERLWLLTQLEGRGDARTAHLVEYRPAAEPETTTRAVADLVVVAEFRDPIYPGLRSTGTVERGGDKPYHIVINGENYHALQALLFAYEGQIDCIYIDPPYNTRDKDWKYNNDYVDSDDAYRHSKWLAMMERRLMLAKLLLNPHSSVLIVTIDEKEVNRLGLLLEQVLGHAPAQLVTIVINPLGQERKQELARVEEYAYFLFFGAAKPHTLADDLLNEPKSKRQTARSKKIRWEWLLRGGADATRQRNPDLFYPIFVDPNKRTIVEVGEAPDRDIDRNTIPAPKGTVAVWPLRESGLEGRWRCSPSYFRELLSLGYAKVGEYDKSRDQWAFLYLGKAQINRIESGEIEVLGHGPDGAVILRPAKDKESLVLPNTDSG